jgi:AraC family transcriptional activator of pobA
MTSKNSSIPQFDLYGEQKLYDNPGFVHIENIADRSLENDWIIKPHRHGKMLQILFIFSGETWVEIDDTHYKFNDGRIITIPPGVVHGFKFKPNTNGKVLTIAEPVVLCEKFKTCKEYFDPILGKSVIIEIEKKSVLLNQLKNFLILIESELERNDIGQELMLVCLLNMLIMTLSRQMDLVNFRRISGTMQEQLLRKFRFLLEQHFREQWSVEQYADALHTSYSTLNRTCKATTGLTTKDHILNRVMIAAKRQLIYTQIPLDQIALQLGFKDPAYFSRIFKKRNSLSPNAYRKLKYREFHTINE